MRATYPATPDLSIKVGDEVRCYDFPGNVSCYCDGVVEEVSTDPHPHFGHAVYRVKVSRVVREDKDLIDSILVGSMIYPPINGLDGMFGLTRGVVKLPSVPTKRTFVVVEYLVATGGSGSTRLYLDELPTWLADKDYPGRLIHALRVI